MTKTEKRATYRCSFCGKSQHNVARLIAGPGGVYICDECVDLCREIIEEEQSSAKPRVATGKKHSISGAWASETRLASLCQAPLHLGCTPTLYPLGARHRLKTIRLDTGLIKGFSAVSSTAWRP